MNFGLSVAAPMWKRRIVNVGSRASPAWGAACAFFQPVEIC